MRVLLAGLAGLLLAGCEQMAVQIGGALINGARLYREPPTGACNLQRAGYQKAGATFEDFASDRDECAKTPGENVDDFFKKLDFCLARKGWTPADPNSQSLCESL